MLRAAESLAAIDGPKPGAPESDYGAAMA